MGSIYFLFFNIYFSKNVTRVYDSSKDAEFKLEKFCHQWFFLRKLYFLSYQQKTDLMGLKIRVFFRVPWKLQFFNSVHWHFRDGVLYEEKHTQTIKFVISWKKVSPLIKTSALDFRAPPERHLHFKASFFTITQKLLNSRKKS